MLKGGSRQLHTKCDFRLGCTMLQGQEVYLRIPKATESYSGGCGLRSCLQVLDFSHHLATGSVFLQNTTELIGDLIVSMNFLDEYAFINAPASDVAIVLVMAFFAVSATLARDSKD